MATGQTLRARPRALGVTLVLVLVAAVAGCFGGDDGDKHANPVTKRITAWSLEFQPDRLRATKPNLAAFTRAARIGVDLVPISDDELPGRMARARASEKLPDVVQIPLDTPGR
jgi:ABC-type glycerol-3-phosphate transport system substrate-binding protein